MKDVIEGAQLHVDAYSVNLWLHDDTNERKNVVVVEYPETCVLVMEVLPQSGSEYISLHLEPLHHHSVSTPRAFPRLHRGNTCRGAVNTRRTHSQPCFPSKA